MRALKRRCNEVGDNAVAAGKIIGGKGRHLVPELRQPKVRQTPIKHTVGIENLAVTHEMKLSGDHPLSVRMRAL